MTPLITGFWDSLVDGGSTFLLANIQPRKFSRKNSLTQFVQCAHIFLCFFLGGDVQENDTWVN